MRLINEDDVLEIIERVTNEAVETNQRKYLIQKRIIAEIAGLPTIEAKDWISVKDKLPEEDRLIHNYFVAIGEWVGIMMFYNGEFREDPFGREPEFPVHHWMPLPEPPEED